MKHFAACALAVTIAASGIAGCGGDDVADITYEDLGIDGDADAEQAASVIFPALGAAVPGPGDTIEPHDYAVYAATSELFVNEAVRAAFVNDALANLEFVEDFWDSLDISAQRQAEMLDELRGPPSELSADTYFRIFQVERLASEILFEMRPLDGR